MDYEARSQKVCLQQLSQLLHTGVIGPGV